MPKAQRHFRHKHTSHPSLLPQLWQRQPASGQKPQHPATEAQRELLRLVTVSEKRWRARSRGAGVDGWSDEGEEGFESGDCDDEDECTGVSGLGPPPRRKRLRIFADLADNLAMDDFTFQEQLLTPRLATAGVGGVSSPAAPLWRSYLVPTFPVVLALLLVCHH
ncbi:glypican-3-like protein [Lates japonicus]|uniref:Glypican-3-like protein n=1 Tax=Lates japonicus TaxID=270547 RepID=A0AAD3R990_LATJO|nr:glypican-3-like protein [Lates japonicus]